MKHTTISMREILSDAVTTVIHLLHGKSIQLAVLAQNIPAQMKNGLQAIEIPGNGQH